MPGISENARFWRVPERVTRSSRGISKRWPFKGLFQPIIIARQCNIARRNSARRHIAPSFRGCPRARARARSVSSTSAINACAYAREYTCSLPRRSIKRRHCRAEERKNAVSAASKQYRAPRTSVLARHRANANARLRTRSLYLAWDVFTAATSLS